MFSTGRQCFLSVTDGVVSASRSHWDEFSDTSLKVDVDGGDGWSYAGVNITVSLCTCDANNSIITSLSKLPFNRLEQGAWSDQWGRLTLRDVSKTTMADGHLKNGSKVGGVHALEVEKHSVHSFHFWASVQLWLFTVFTYTPTFIWQLQLLVCCFMFTVQI